MRSFACRSRACAGRTSGPIAARSPSTVPRRWATSTAASSRRSAATCGRIRRGQFVVGSFATSDNTCPHCRHGYQSSCVQREFMSDGAGAAAACATRGWHAGGDRRGAVDDLLPSLLAASDVLGTGWFAADAADVKPGATVAVVGDGAVGLLGVLSAKQMGAERIIAMSRHAARQALAREFGATDIVTERGDEGVARIKELTKGVGADSVLECVGTQESMLQAIHATRPGGGGGLRRRAARRRARRRAAVLLARAPARRPGAGAPIPATPHRSRPEGPRSIPARSSTSRCPLDQVAEGYRAMDERRAIKALLRP